MRASGLVSNESFLTSNAVLENLVRFSQNESVVKQTAEEGMSFRWQSSSKNNRQIYRLGEMSHNHIYNTVKTIWNSHVEEAFRFAPINVYRFGYEEDMLIQCFVYGVALLIDKGHLRRSMHFRQFLDNVYRYTVGTSIYRDLCSLHLPETMLATFNKPGDSDDYFSWSKMSP